MSDSNPPTTSEALSGTPPPTPPEKENAVPADVPSSAVQDGTGRGSTSKSATEPATVGSEDSGAEDASSPEVPAADPPRLDIGKFFESKQRESALKSEIASMRSRAEKEDARLFRLETQLATVMRPIRMGSGSEKGYDADKTSWFSAKEEEAVKHEEEVGVIEERLGSKKRDLETRTAVLKAKKEAGAKEIEALEELLRKRRAKVIIYSHSYQPPVRLICVSAHMWVPAICIMHHIATKQSQVAEEITELKKELELDEKSNEVDELIFARDSEALEAEEVRDTIRRVSGLQKDLEMGRKGLKELQNDLPRKLKAVAEESKTLEQIGKIKVPVQIINLAADVLWETSDLLSDVIRVFPEDRLSSLYRVRDFLVGVGCKSGARSLRVITEDFVSLLRNWVSTFFLTCELLPTGN